MVQLVTHYQEKMNAIQLETPPFAYTTGKSYAMLRIQVYHLHQHLMGITLHDCYSFKASQRTKGGTYHDDPVSKTWSKRSLSLSLMSLAAFNSTHVCQVWSHTST